MEELITLDVLKSFAGATAVVITATEVIKKSIMLVVPKKKKLPDIVPILVALGSSLAVTVGTTILSGAITVVSIILAVLNGFAVFGSATGSYRAAKIRNPKI